MIKNKYEHIWKIYTDVGVNASIPATYKCEKCSTIMTASEVYQLETLKHLQGFQKWIGIIAICVATASLIISGLVSLLK